MERVIISQSGSTEQLGRREAAVLFQQYNSRSNGWDLRNVRRNLIHADPLTWDISNNITEKRHRERERGDEIGS